VPDVGPDQAKEVTLDWGARRFQLPQKVGRSERNAPIR